MGNTKDNEIERGDVELKLIEKIKQLRDVFTKKEIEQILKNHEIVERLKKQIKEIKIEPLTNQQEIDFTSDQYHAWMKRELQKIRGDIHG